MTATAAATTAAATTTGAAPDGPRSPWDRFFFAPQSTSPMALLRLAWGALAALWALTLLPDVDPLLTDGALGYDRGRPAGSWNLLDLIGWDGAPLATCLLLVVAALATMVGYRTRLSAAVGVLCMICLQRANPTVFNSGDLALRQVGIAVALAPSGLLLSIDAWRRRGRGVPRPAGDDDAADDDGPPERRWSWTAAPLRAPWALRLLQLELVLGYALSGWAKLRGSTWHDGTALGLAMRIEDLQRFVAPQWLFEQDVLLNVLTWATLAFEASFLFLVWNRRLRPWVLGLGVLFHIGIDVLFDVGFFSWVMIAAYLAFLPPEVADRWIARVERWWHERRSAATVPLAVEPAE
jgi:hypothetical protein